MHARTLAACLLLVLSPAFAGCFTAEDEANAEVARPRIGDVAEYAVSGHLVELARWSNGVPLTSSDARVRFTLTEAAGAVDGFGAYHPAYRVATEVKDGPSFRPHRASLVAPEHAAVTQSFLNIGASDNVVAFDERGYPWAWGASLLHGRTLERGATFDAVLPANAGQPEDLPVRFVVDGRGTVGGVETWRVTLTRPGDVSWTLWMDPDVPFPVRVEITMDGGALHPFVRVNDRERELAFTANLVDFTRGSEPTPPRDSSRAWLDAPIMGTFSAWDREMPPEGDGQPYVAFRLADAIAWAKLLDFDFQSWLDARPGAILYRGTYFQEPGPVDGTRVHVWLIAYVSPEDEYYEVQVERTDVDVALPDLPIPVGVTPPGLPQVTASGPVDAPRGEHGWFPPDAIPERLLTIDAGVAIMRTFFPPDGVEIFVRSFTDPVGYAYYVDGGFEEEMGRYTVIVNAQTGFVQAAVGPVDPLVQPLGSSG